MRNPPNIMASDRVVARLTSGLFVLLMFGYALQLVISLALAVAKLLRLPVAVTVVAIILSIAGLALLSIRFWAYASRAIERQSARTGAYGPNRKLVAVLRLNSLFPMPTRCLYRRSSTCGLGGKLTSSWRLLRRWY